GGGKTPLRGQDAARKFLNTLRAGEELSAQLEELIAANSDDEDFSAAMMRELGTNGVLTVPGLIGLVYDSEAATTDLMSSVAELVATATNGHASDMPGETKHELINAAASTRLMGQGGDGVVYRPFW